MDCLEQNAIRQDEKNYLICQRGHAPSPHAFHKSASDIRSLTGTYTSVGWRQWRSSLQNPARKQEWEPRDEFGTDRTTPLSLTAIQMKSTSGSISVPGEEEMGLRLGFTILLCFLLQLLSFPLIVHRLQPLDSAVSSIMYLDHVDEFSFTADALQVRTFTEHVWGRRDDSWMKLNRNIHSGTTHLTLVFTEIGSVMEGHTGSTGGRVSWMSGITGRLVSCY